MGKPEVLSPVAFKDGWIDFNVQQRSNYLHKSS